MRREVFASLILIFFAPCDASPPPRFCRHYAAASASAAPPMFMMPPPARYASARAAPCQHYAIYCFCRRAVLRYAADWHDAASFSRRACAMPPPVFCHCLRCAPLRYLSADAAVYACRHLPPPPLSPLFAATLRALPPFAPPPLPRQPPPRRFRSAKAPLTRRLARASEAALSRRRC